MVSVQSAQYLALTYVSANPLVNNRTDADERHGIPVASETLELKSSSPHSTNPGATIAWKTIACAIIWVLCATIAHADQLHRKAQIVASVAVMLCRSACSSLSSPTSASRITRIT